jgi:hypothetical protein
MVVAGVIAAVLGIFGLSLREWYAEMYMRLFFNFDEDDPRRSRWRGRFVRFNVVWSWLLVGGGALLAVAGIASGHGTDP